MGFTGGSNPPYLFSHTGPCIVAGSAWCLHDDLKTAWSRFPDAPVVAVNEAAREISALALFSYHPARFVEPPYLWIQKQHKRFGGGFTVHGATQQPDMPWVDYWWPPISGSRGGSAWGARKLAALMGFSPVVLCGCPLLPGNYAGHRPGLLMTRQGVVDQLLSEIEADTDWHDGVYSPSGRTRELLGAP